MYDKAPYFYGTGRRKSSVARVRLYQGTGKITIKDGATVTVKGADIDNICCKTTEYDDFQLTNALLERNRSLVFETLYRQKSSFEPAPTILASVMRMYTELFLVQRLYSQGQGKAQIASATGIHEFKVGMYLRAINGVNPKKFARAVELCAEADVKYKSASNTSAYLVLERLISALCVLFC